MGKGQIIHSLNCSDNNRTTVAIDCCVTQYIICKVNWFCGQATVKAGKDDCQSWL